MVKGKLPALKFHLVLLFSFIFTSSGLKGQNQIELSLIDHSFEVEESKKFMISTEAIYKSKTDSCRSWEYNYYLNVKYIGRINKNYIYEVDIDPFKRTPQNLINISSFKFEFEVLTSGEILSVVNWNYIKQRVKNNTYFTDEQSVIKMFDDVLKQLFIVYGQKYQMNVPVLIPTMIGEFGLQSVDGNLTLNMYDYNESFVKIGLKEEIMDILDLDENKQIPSVVDCFKVSKKMKNYDKTGHFLVNIESKEVENSATEVKCGFEDSSFVFRRFIELI